MGLVIIIPPNLAAIQLVAARVRRELQGSAEVAIYYASRRSRVGGYGKGNCVPRDRTANREEGACLHGHCRTKLLGKR